MKCLTLLLLVLTTPVFTFSQIKNTNKMDKWERYQRGLEKLKVIDGEAGVKVVEGLKDISPELSKYIVEYAFGDVYSLDKLDNKSKEIAAVSSLITQGAIPQLKVHLNGALNTGCSLVEIKELVLHTSAYVGFPKTINAMNALKEVLAERKEKGIIDEKGIEISENDNISRYEVGSKYLALLDEKQEQVIKDAYEDFAPALAQFVVEYGYGDIYSRESLNRKYRQIATIAALTTLGNVQSQLKFHIQSGLNIGLTVEEVKEVMMLMSVYSGFPSAINGTNVLKEIVDENFNK